MKGFIEISQSGSMLTITLKKVQDTAANTDIDRYNPEMGYKITVKAKDSADVEVTSKSLISVVQNQAPTMKTDDVDAIPHFRIGTQPDKVPAGHGWPRAANTDAGVGAPYTCATFNACILKFVQSSDTDTTMNYHFFDYGTLTYEATVDADQAGYISITPVAGGIMISGMKSTVKTVDAVLQNRFTEEGISVSVTATDSEGLTSEPRTFQVVVDGQPTSTLPAARAITTDGVTMELSLYFKNAETAAAVNFTYAAIDENDVAIEEIEATRAASHKHVRASILERVLTLSPGDLPGSREITVKATEPGTVAAATDATGVIGQYVESKMTVTNNKEY